MESQNLSRILNKNDLKKLKKSKNNPKEYQWWHVSCIPKSLMRDAVHAMRKGSEAPLVSKVTVSAWAFATGEIHAMLLAERSHTQVHQARATGCKHVKRCELRRDNVSTCILSGLAGDSHAG